MSHRIIKCIKAEIVADAKRVVTKAVYKPIYLGPVNYSAEASVKERKKCMEWGGGIPFFGSAYARYQIGY